MRGCLFFGGFFSKHAVLGQAQTVVGPVIFTVILVVGRIITCLYRVRLASSLLKLNKLGVVSPVQVGLLGCVLVGGGFISKLLFFDLQFNS